MKKNSDLIDFLNLSIGGATDVYLRELTKIVSKSRNAMLTPELVVVPAGNFEMGGNECNDEQPIHTVHIASFMMGKYPVTQAQWVTVMGSNPSYFQVDDSLPVENVSWSDVQAFIHKLNQLTGHTYRLPSEAEWEYACRAGGSGQQNLGNDESQLGQYVWYGKNSDRKTHPVGQKKPNAFGLHDMLGNVWEWCEDVWHGNYQDAPTNGRAWVDGWDQTRRVLRGSSWIDDPQYLRSANRNGNSMDTKYGNIGFRLAQTTLGGTSHIS